MADLGTGSTRARLLGLAADMIRLFDTADARGWDVRGLIYDVVVGDDDEQNEGRVDALLSTPLDFDSD